jgi:hypothetical protein
MASTHSGKAVYGSGKSWLLLPPSFFIRNHPPHPVFLPPASLSTGSESNHNPIMKPIKAITALAILLGTCLIAGAEGKPGKPGKPHPKGPPPEMLKKFDKDGDGKLSEDERKAMREAIQERHKDKFKEFDKDGDGKLSKEEKEAMKAARKAEWLKKYDTDGDGKLSDEERKAMPERPAGPGNPNAKGRPGKPDGKGRDFKRDGKNLKKPAAPPAAVE